MKLYMHPLAPNPRKVIVYVKEKGIDLPFEEVDIAEGHTRRDDFLKKNPLGAVPVLELDDGSHLTESTVIVRYLEELHPEPCMVGTTPLERARIGEVERIADVGVIASVGAIFQNTSPLFAGRVKQSAEAAEAARDRLASALTTLDRRIGGQPFAAGDVPTIADCTLFAGLAFMEVAHVDLDPAFQNVGRWYESFRSRPSTR